MSLSAENVQHTKQNKNLLLCDRYTKLILLQMAGHSLSCQQLKAYLMAHYYVIINHETFWLLVISFYFSIHYCKVMPLKTFTLSLSNS